MRLLWLASLMACTSSARELEVYEDAPAEPEPVVVAAPPPCVDLPGSTTYPKDRELSIFVKHIGLLTVERGTTPAVSAAIRYGAERGWRRVPMPVAGSAYAVVEPAIWWKVYVEQPGSTCPHAVPEHGGGFVTDVDDDWRDDVVRLRVWQSREVDPVQVAEAWRRLDFTGIPAGRMTAYLHYAYTAGREHPDPEERAEFDAGPMKGQPPFELVSGPVEVELVLEQ